MALVDRAAKPAAAQPASEPSQSGSELKSWPVDRWAWRDVALPWPALVAVLSALGLLVVHVLEDGAFGRGDVAVSEWFAEQRSPRLEDVGQIASGLSDTLTVIPFCAVLIAFFAWRWRRWNEAILVVGALLYEKAVFLPVTMIAGRDRPPVGQLDGNPPSSSFFSGHVAAAVALYFGLWLIVRRRTSSRVVEIAMTIVASAAVVAVALSRLLLGMHYLSDVVVGLAVGAVSLLIVDRALAGAERRKDAQARQPEAQLVTSPS